MATGAGADKVLTTDVSGVASWQTPAGGSLWTQTGNDIYYNTGNVGIGTTAPTNILSLGNAANRKFWIENTAAGTVGRALTVAAGGTVAGGTNITGGNLILQSGSGTGTGASTISFQTGTTLGSGTTLQTLETKMTILGSGNVGIGTTNPQTKLDVAGAIKIGTQDTCNANNEGAIRYVSASKKFEGCNGTSWRLIEGLFPCGVSVTFTYKGSSVTYGTVSSTGDKCWMDRNLGASQVATSQTDANAYGDLFQWGRLSDGHQTRTSGTTTTLSSTDNPGHSNFITNTASPYDWRSPQNNNLWQGVLGVNNPCPSGWRLPTTAEMDTEQASWSPKTSAGAFASPLKLTLAGFRANTSATLTNVGASGNYWTSPYLGNSYLMYFDSGGSGFYLSYRALGISVRCLKD